MKIKYLLPIILLFIASSVSAETLQVDFAFNHEPAPQSYKLYKDSAFVCEFQEDGTKTGSCAVSPLPYGDNNFTLTAISDGFESPHSPVYVFNKELGAPTIKAVISISVIVNQ